MNFKQAIAAALSAAAHLAAAADRPITVTEPVIVTATRFEDRYIDGPVNVTVVSEEDIRRSAAKTLPELLAEQAGITVRDFFGNNAATTAVDLRGFGASATQNTLILLDGRRLTDIDLSGVQWAAVPLSAIERIEILRGGGAVLYGDGATTGVINIITRSAGRRPNAATVSGRMSSYSTSETLLSADYFGTTAGFSVNASNFESDGYRSNNRNRQSNFLGDFRFKTGGGDVSLKLAADRQGLRLPGARQVQPSAGVNQLLTDRRGAQTPLDYTQRDGNRASLDWRQPVAFGEFIIGAGWRDKEQTSYFDFGGFPDYRIADLDVWSFTPRVKIGLPAMAAGGTLIAGMDWHRWGYRLRRSNSPRNITAPFNTIDATQENIAWYAFNTVQLTERLTAVVGARTERFKADASDRHDPAAPGGAFGSGAPAGSQRESERAYEVGARYELFPGLALTGKTTRSYRFANVDEIYETSPLFTNEFQFLRPQTARAYEAGIEVRGAAGFARAALFTMDVRDEIHLDAYTTGIGNTNLPPSRRRGLELEGRWTPAERLTLGAAYTHIDARFLQGLLPGAAFTQTNVLVAGKTVPLVPRHKLNANASWALDARTRLNAIATYVGKQFMDNDEGNTLGAQIPSYAVVDFKLVHRHGPWTLSAALNNAFNEKYFNYAVRSQFVADRYNAYPLPERNGTLTVEYALR